MTQSSSALTLTLPSDREIVMTRIFDAPPALVFEAHSKCEHVEKWWGLSACEMDFRPGGAYRFVSRGPDGAEDAFRGDYRDIVRPERIVNTFEWEGMPGHISVDTLDFEEHDGKTKLISTSLFDSVEDRDGMLSSGMEAGATESWDRLAELLATLVKA